MKLYYTIYHDGDEYPQLYQIADNPNKLSKRISDAYSDREYTPNIYVYDTDSKDPLESDEESQLTLYKNYKTV